MTEFEKLTESGKESFYQWFNSTAGSGLMRSIDMNHYHRDFLRASPEQQNKAIQIWQEFKATAV